MNNASGEPGARPGRETRALDDQEASPELNTYPEKESGDIDVIWPGVQKSAALRMNINALSRRRAHVVSGSTGEIDRHTACRCN